MAARVDRWLALPLVGLAACSGRPEIYVEADVEPEPVEAVFHIRMDPASPALDGGWLQPISGPVEVRGAATAGRSADVTLTAYVKKLPNRKDVLGLELLFENGSPVGMTAVAVALGTAGEAGAGARFYDLAAAPFGDDPVTRVSVGGIVAGGVGRVYLGVPGVGDGGEREFTVTLRGRKTTRRASRSAPLVVTPDGDEVWTAVPDADVVAVVDTAQRRRVASVAVPGRPTSVAVSTDGRLVLVTSSAANRVTVIERASRRVVQQFGEEHGIGRDPRHVAVTPDGSRALVSAYTGDRVSSLVRRGDRYHVEGHIAVGRRPAGFSVSPDSRYALVAHYLPRGKVMDNHAWVSVVDISTLTVHREAVIDDHLNSTGANCLAKLFRVAPGRATAEGVDTQLAGVFMHPSGSTAWIPHASLAPVPVFERGPNSVDMDPSFDIRPAEIVPGFLTLLDTRAPGDAATMPNPGMLDRPTSVDYMRCAQMPLSIESIDSVPVPGSEHELTDRFAAFPSAYTPLAPSGVSRFVAFSAAGRLAWSLSYVSDAITEVDAATFHPSARRPLVLSGSNPIGMALSPDGRTGYVAYENSTFVSVLDVGDASDAAAPGYVPYQYRALPGVPGGTAGTGDGRQLIRDVSELAKTPALAEVARIALVDRDPMDPVLRRGKVLFTSSNTEKHPSLSAVTMTACTSCHPDGGSDGSVWATMEGERRTMSLRGGVRGRGWLHIAATHRDIGEFVDAVVSERLGGDLSAADRDALARYVADAIPRNQTPSVDPTLAARGEALFTEHCTGCHSGDRRTSGAADPGHPWGGGDPRGPELHDVGTAVADAHVVLPSVFESLLPAREAEILRLTRGDRALGPDDPLQQKLDFRPRPERARGEFKAPSLIDLHDQVLYFHDGRFDRLDDVVRYFDDALSLELGDADVAALTAYLRTL